MTTTTTTERELTTALRAAIRRGGRTHRDLGIEYPAASLRVERLRRRWVVTDGWQYGVTWDTAAEAEAALR